MGDFPLIGTGQIANQHGVSTFYLVNVTSSSTANTKGSYTEIAASTSHIASGLYITTTCPVSEADYLFDIAIGGGGSEVDIVPNILQSVSTTSGRLLGASYFFPISIPMGTRISARSQNNQGGASHDISVQVHLVSGGIMQSGAGVITHGANTADSGGTSVDPGAVGSTKGSYTELVAVTSYPYLGFSLDFGNQRNQATAWCQWNIDLAIGGAGSETIILPDFHLTNNSAVHSVHPRKTPFFPIHIPAGVRIAARAACDSTDATDRLIDIVFHGVY